MFRNKLRQMRVKNTKPQNVAVENRSEGCGEGAAAENSEMMIRIMTIRYI
jgi:hypothetical protein